MAPHERSAPHPPLKEEGRIAAPGTPSRLRDGVPGDPGWGEGGAPNATPPLFHLPLPPRKSAATPDQVRGRLSPLQAEGKSAIFAANRAEGRVSLAIAATACGIRCTSSREDGSLRVRFPSACAGAPEAVLVNTAGGLAGGDRFAVDLDLGPGARLTVTTASAEKVYRSLGPAARADVTANLADGAELLWLPHETILFDRARLERTVDVTLAPTAALAFAETVVFGRAAMGETVAQGHFSDRWRIRRGGRLIFAENFSLDGAIAARLREAAIANGHSAIGTLLLVPGDDEMVAAVRAAAKGAAAGAAGAAGAERAEGAAAGAERAEGCRGELGISAWNGIALARFAAADGAALRHDLALVLRSLGRTLPRLWQN
jgi:urease accessory protein